jgi:acetyltransferase-like isoleucine patch superfamily enzyme
MRRIGRHVSISGDCVLGDDVTIGNGVTIYSGVTIGPGTTVLDGAVLGRAPKSAGSIVRALQPPGPLRIGAHSIVGANAVLYAGSEIGDAVLIGDLASLREGCRLGDQVVVGRGAMVMYDAVIGERSRVIDAAIITGGMHIEEDVFIGPGVCTINDNGVYLRRFGLEPFEAEGPIVRRFAVIGAGANVAAGVEIGRGAIVAPSAMVTRSVAPWTVVAGVPAKMLREVPAEDRRRILARFELPTDDIEHAA